MPDQNPALNTKNLLPASLRAIALGLLLCLSLTANAQYKTYHGDGPDDVLRFVPLAATVGLKICGVESRSSWAELAVDGGLSVAFTVASTWGLKQMVHDVRPDGTDSHAFPSGHTSFAFAGARILDREYRHISPWISVGGYTVATFTAVDRLLRNRHRIDDVLAGAVIGVASSELGYWLGSRILSRKSSCALSLTPTSAYFTVIF